MSTNRECLGESTLAASRIGKPRSPGPRSRKRRLTPFATLLSFLFLQCTLAADQTGQADYLRGLDALQRQQWKDAATALAAATDADEENADFHTAYGIATMLSGDLKVSKKEFDRALRLNGKDVTIQRWAAAYYRYIGDALTASKIRSPADYPRTVQEAAELVYQIDHSHRIATPQEAVERRKNLYEFAVTYAREKKGANPQLTAISFDRAKQLFDQGKYDEALNDIQTALDANPYDNDALFLHARCLLAKGYPYGAREELTRVITADTTFAPGYAARSIVEARIGALDRAAADFQVAQKLDPNTAMLAQKDYEQAVAESREDASGEAAQKYDALVKAAEPCDNADSLLGPGQSVIRAQNNRRRRWDEIYQDKLRVLEDEVRATQRKIGGTPALPLMNLGKFLYIESDIPGEQLSPGGTYRAFRFNTPYTREQEILRADKTFDQVLAIDPKNAEALAWKASIRIDRRDFDGGEALVSRALAINPELPQLLELLARILDHTATLKQYQAADLRTPRSWTQFGISYDIIWTRYPSQAELQQAGQLEAMANNLWARAEASLGKAVDKIAGSADGFYYTGLLQQHHNDHEASLESFRQAARLDPDSYRGQKALIRALFRLDKADEAAVEQEKWALAHQTTATTRLARAWGEMDQTKWKTASTTVDSALQIDPADPRIPAYRAAIATARGKPDEAARWLVVALALENARVRVGGVDLSPAGKGVIPPDAGGLTLLLNLHLAWRFHDMSAPDKQQATLLRNVAIDARFVEGVREQSPSAAVLPTPADKRSTKPRTVSNLIAWSRVLAGYGYVEQGKIPEAEVQFKPIAGLYKRDSYVDPQALAVNELARLRWAKKDPDKSRRTQWLQNAKILNRMTDEERRAALDLMSQAGRDAGLRMDQIQIEQADLKYFYGATPSGPGGYDPRNNPNYHGADDAPPGMASGAE